MEKNPNNYEPNEVFEYNFAEGDLELDICFQMVVHEVDQLLGTEHFLAANKPLILSGVELTLGSISFHVHRRDSQVWNRVKAMVSKNCLNFLLVVEIENSEEDLFLLCCKVHASRVDERVDHFFVFSFNLGAMLTILINVEQHNNIIWPWILEN